MEPSSSQILTFPSTRLKVSTTQPGQAAIYGKQNIFDGKEETSWYSAPGKFQYICVFFDENTQIEAIDITFCGGFGPKELEISYSENDEYDNKKPIFSQCKTVSIEDNNKPISIPIEIAKCRTIRLGMKQFYDLYGRVIVYDMKIKGKVIKV